MIHLCGFQTIIKVCQFSRTRHFTPHVSFAAPIHLMVIIV